MAMYYPPPNHHHHHTPTYADHRAKNGYHILSMQVQFIFQHVSLWYLFLPPHQTTYHLNIGVVIRKKQQNKGCLPYMGFNLQTRHFETLHFA